MIAQKPDRDFPVDWPAIVANLKIENPQGRDDLHRIFFSGIRFVLGRRLGPLHLLARAEETFTIVVNAVKTKDLGYESVPGLVRTIVLKQIGVYGGADLTGGAEFRAVILGDTRQPENKAIHFQNQNRMVRLLSGMSLRDQEAVTRFYLHGQKQEKICEEMHLSQLQFGILKANAKAAFYGPETNMATP